MSNMADEEAIAENMDIDHDDDGTAGKMSASAVSTSPLGLLPLVSNLLPSLCSRMGAGCLNPCNSLPNPQCYTAVH